MQKNRNFSYFIITLPCGRTEETMNKPLKRLTGKEYLLGVQHLFAMFGATVTVPIMTGMNPSIALLTAGLGTLIFHLITKGIVPVFLGSSFAFMSALIAIIGGNTANIPKAQGGIIVAGLIYVVFAILVYFLGIERIKKLFPPIVTGPVIIVIGLTLSPSAITNASSCWLLAIIVLVAIITVMCFTRGFIKMMPIILGLLIGYGAALLLDATGATASWGLAESGKLIDFTAVEQASWFFDFSAYTLPQFDLSSILMIAPIALVTFMEHIGDITTNGAVVGKDFYSDPGLHRTLLGDGIATAFAGLLGGPPNTTYGENTGVLAVTKNYDPRIIRLAALFAIILGLIGKFGAILQTIPTAIIGAVSFVLYGMISSIGLRSLVESKPDFSRNRNLLIVAVILVTGLGMPAIQITETVSISGLFVATLVGVLLNVILPQEKKEEE